MQGQHVSLCTLLAACCLTLSLASQSTFPVDWAKVALTPPTSKNLTASCTCNLHPFVCDRDCCCDSDCPQAASDASKKAGACRPEGPAEQTLDFCVPDGFVAKVNLPTSSDFFTLKKQAADDNFFGQLLCITKSSSPKLSDSYQDPAVGDADGNPSLATCPSATTTPSAPATYQSLTPLYVSRSGGAKQELTLPAPVFSASCVDQALVGFLKNIPEKPEDTFQSCVRSIPSAATLQSLCADGAALSPVLYTNFTFAATPTAAASVDPFLPDVLLSDGTTQTASGFTSSFDTTSGVCSNAVQHVNVTVFYSLADSTSVQATITRISVALSVTNVSATDGVHQQFVRVNFVDSALQSELLVPYSGNPGYLQGLPVLAGALEEDANSDKTAVKRFVKGLTAPQGSVTDGTCLAKDGATVRFGANATTSCAVDLTQAELNTFCTSGTPQQYVEAAMGDVYTALVAENARVGIWGNSFANNTNEWLTVRVSNFPFNAMAASSSPTSCSNVVVGYDLQILTGVAFSANNLQSKVLYAHLCFKTATWTFPASKTATDKHRFYLTSSTSFVPKEQERQTDITKPRPPLKTQVPENLFYPFVTSGAQQQQHSFAGKAVAAIVAIVLLMAL